MPLPAPGPVPAGFPRQVGREMAEPKPSKPALPMQSEVAAKGTGQEAGDPGSDWLTLKVPQSTQGPTAHFGPQTPLGPIACLDTPLGTFQINYSCANVGVFSRGGKFPRRPLKRFMLL